MKKPHVCVEVHAEAGLVGEFQAAIGDGRFVREDFPLKRPLNHAQFQHARVRQRRDEMAGRWEKERGPQQLAYDFWWHLGSDTMITSEWGTPNMVKDGVNPELLLAGKYGHALHVWDLRKRRHLQTIDLGENHQMALEVRPAHDPAREHGFVLVTVADK